MTRSRIFAAGPLGAIAGAFLCYVYLAVRP